MIKTFAGTGWYVNGCTLYGFLTRIRNWKMGNHMSSDVKDDFPKEVHWVSTHCLTWKMTFRRKSLECLRTVRRERWLSEGSPLSVYALSDVKDDFPKEVPWVSTHCLTWKMTFRRKSIECLRTVWRERWLSEGSPLSVYALIKGKAVPLQAWSKEVSLSLEIRVIVGFTLS